MATEPSRELEQSFKRQLKSKPFVCARLRQAFASNGGVYRSFIKEDLMLRQVLILVSAIIATSTCSADEPTAEESILKVYPVGNIVSASAINSSMGGKSTAAEWAANYPETTAALDELRGIVEATCSQKPMAVTVFRPSLSLIVRHTKDGHDEIVQLLESLAESNEAAIQIECRALYSQSPTEIDAAELTDEQQKELQRLLSQPRLTKAETSALKALLPTAVGYSTSVALIPGRRTAWGWDGRPCTAMARINREKNVVEVRFDYVADDYVDAIPFGTQVLSLSDGESAFFHHYCDGGRVVCLVTATAPRSDALNQVSQAAR